MPRLFLPNGDFGMGRRIDLLQYGEASQKIDYLCAQRANGLFAQAYMQIMSPGYVTSFDQAVYEVYLQAM